MVMMYSVGESGFDKPRETMHRTPTCATSAWASRRLPWSADRTILLIRFRGLKTCLFQIGTRTKIGFHDGR